MDFGTFSAEPFATRHNTGMVFIKATDKEKLPQLMSHL